MEATFKRVQMLLEPEQHEALRAQAQASGISVAELTRRAITRGLDALRSEEVRARRAEALRQARQLRKRQELRGAPMITTVSDDLDAIREERDSELAGHS